MWKRDGFEDGGITWVGKSNHGRIAGASTLLQLPDFQLMKENV